LSDKPGQAFVNFKDHNSAKKAIDEVNLKLKIENAVLLVSPHIYR
jgi:RNA recognition motif-containing protein